MRQFITLATLALGCALLLSVLSGCGPTSPEYNADGTGELSGRLTDVGSDMWTTESGGSGYRQLITVRSGSWLSPKSTEFVLDDSTLASIDGRSIPRNPGSIYGAISRLDLDGSVAVEVEYVRRELDGPAGEKAYPVASSLEFTTAD